MTDTGFRLVYVTTPNRETALRLAHAVVRARLAACANVLDNMTSVYHWDGKLNEELETVLLLKTGATHVERLIVAIKAQHPYDCPCIVALPITDGHAPYLDWLNAELAPTELAPTELAPTELAPTELAPTELAPQELAPHRA